MSTLTGILRGIWRALDGLRKVLHLVLLLGFFLIVLASLSPRIPLVPARAALVIAPQGVLVEQLSGDPLERALAEFAGQDRAETLVHDLVDAIDAAADDERIVALVIEPGSLLGGGIAKLEEIAAAIQRYRATGRPVIAMADYYDQSQYYLAAQADEIYLDPQGVLLVDGYGYYRTYLQEAIEKLGIDVHIFRAGRYKSYTEMFSRNDMSEAEREETLAWTDALWRSYQANVEAARGLDPGAIGDYVADLVPGMQRNAGDLASVALEYGLVTEIKSRAEVGERLVALTGENGDEERYVGISHDDYLLAVHGHEVLEPQGDETVGIVVASGVFLDGDHPPGTVGGESMARLLREARLDESIRAVVLRIDSPGGSVFASELIRREVEALRLAGKPVVASMSSTAASAAYYIATEADEIWANPATLTGSIGVFAVFPTFERTLAKLGVHVDGLGTTDFSGAFRPDRPLGEASARLLQLRVDADYRRFVTHVAEARNMSFEEADAVAQGRVWAGMDAEERGLVDHLGSFDQAVDAAAALADLGDEYDVRFLEPSRTWRQELALQFRAAIGHFVGLLERRGLGSPNTLVQRWSPLLSELERIARLSDSRATYYYCPCTIDR